MGLRNEEVARDTILLGSSQDSRGFVVDKRFMINTHEGQMPNHGKQEKKVE